MLVITRGDVYRSKSGVDEGSGLLLSGGSFEGTCDSDLDGEGPGEGDPQINLERTAVKTK